MTTTTKAWIRGLATAFIGAFATAASGALALPTVFNFSHDGLWNIVKLTLVPALVSVFAYLQKSPLPSDSETVTTTLTTSKAPLVILLVVGMGMLSGCGTTAAAPAGPAASTPYQKAATVMLDFSEDVLLAQKAETNLFHGGAIPADVHKAVETAFLQVGQYGPQIDALIAAQASSVTITAKVQAALDSLNTILNATSALDANTKQQISVSIQAIQVVLQGVTAALNPTVVLEVPDGSRNNRYLSRAGLAGRSADLQTDPGGSGSIWTADAADRRDPGRGRRVLRADCGEREGGIAVNASACQNRRRWRASVAAA